MILYIFSESSSERIARPDCRTKSSILGSDGIVYISSLFLAKRWRFHCYDQFQYFYRQLYNAARSPSLCRSFYPPDFILGSARAAHYMSRNRRSFSANWARTCFFQFLPFRSRLSELRRFGAFLTAVFLIWAMRFVSFTALCANSFSRVIASSADCGIIRSEVSASSVAESR